jgi:hypothetical protein
MFSWQSSLFVLPLASRRRDGFIISLSSPKSGAASCAFMASIFALYRGKMNPQVVQVTDLLGVQCLQRGQRLCVKGAMALAKVARNIQAMKRIMTAVKR